MKYNGQLPTAKARPSKEFFTDTLTRDIALSDCILDLVDNSIHSLITRLKLDVSEHYFAGTNAPRIGAQIRIALSASEFTLDDDCGGISIDDAEERIFLFGSPVKEKTTAGLGVYGIGMKRAFFKIGEDISFASHTTEEEFTIRIDVDKWKKTTEWDFPFSSARQKRAKKGGTRIKISKLFRTVTDQFVSKAFKTILLEKIQVAFALFLKAGLDISVNGDTAKADLPDLAESENLRTARHMIKKDGVDILIMAGLSPKTDRKPRGWYVFCNGRMVLDADKTEKTGWSTDSYPGFHVKYNHFLGYVFFRSKDVQKLPWTTTKEGVDRESPIYQSALAEMRLLSRPVLDFFNTLYEDVKEQSEPAHTLLKQAKPVESQKAASRNNASFLARVKTESDDYLASILYRRPIRKIKKIRKALERPSMSASMIGQYTFDWFYDRNCK